MYAEIKFFKNIRHRLKISDENILAVFPVHIPLKVSHLERGLITKLVNKTRIPYQISSIN